MKLLMMLLLLILAAWLAWRGCLFLRLLLAPVREAMIPLDRAAGAHLAGAMNRSGLGKLADFGARVGRAVNHAADESQATIDRRRSSL